MFWYRISFAIYVYTNEHELETKLSQVQYESGTVESWNVFGKVVSEKVSIWMQHVGQNLSVDFLSMACFSKILISFKLFSGLKSQNYVLNFPVDFKKKEPA